MAGVASELIAPDWSTGVTIGLAVYLITYYVARFTWYKGVDKASLGKIYTTGIGGFVLVFLFAWTLFFTLQTAAH